MFNPRSVIAVPTPGRIRNLAKVLSLRELITSLLSTTCAVTPIIPKLLMSSTTEDNVVPDSAISKSSIRIECPAVTVGLVTIPVIVPKILP